MPEKAVWEGQYMAAKVKDPDGQNLFDVAARHFDHFKGKRHGLYAVQAKMDKPMGAAARNTPRIIKVGKFNKSGLTRLWDYGNMYGNEDWDNSKFQRGKEGKHGVDVLALIDSGPVKEGDEQGKSRADNAEERLINKLKQIDPTWQERQRSVKGTTGAAGKRGVERFYLTPRQVLEVMFSKDVVEAPDDLTPARRSGRKKASEPDRFGSFVKH
jgi:hypothetical protein